MKAILKLASEPGLSWEEVEVPEPAEGEVLIRPLKTAICGTDLHIDRWDSWAQKNLKPPVIIGHEFVGLIEKLGPGVKHFHVGERVVGEGHITCGRCRNCLRGKRHYCVQTVGLGVHRDGCFAEYFTLPAENLFRIPDTLENKVAAIFDPFGNAVHTALTHELAGEDILITGMGPIGLMTVMLAKFLGARTIVATDVNHHRLEMAKKLGATEVLNVSRTPLEAIMPTLLLDGGFTVGLEMSGNPQAFESMVKHMQHGGKIALLGILPQDVHLDWDGVIFKSLTLTGIYGRRIFGTWFKGLHLIQAGLPLESIITHTFPAADWEQGFNVMRSGECGKVILDWT